VKCKNCDSTCATCSGSLATNCYSCSGSLQFQSSSNTCISSCPDGYSDYLSSGSCLKCNSTCKTCSGADYNQVNHSNLIQLIILPLFCLFESAWLAPLLLQSTNQLAYRVVPVERSLWIHLQNLVKTAAHCASWTAQAPQRKTAMKSKSNTNWLFIFSAARR